MKTGIYKSLLLASAGALLINGCVVRETRYREQPVATTGVVVETEPPPGGRNGDRFAWA